MSLVVAVDVGIKNLGLCVYDFMTNRVVLLENVNLVPNGRYSPAQNVQYVRNFIARYQSMFDAASVVLVERQMRCNMRIIEAILETMFYGKCIVVNARCVKLHYGIGTRNYRANKAKAIEWVNEFMHANPAVFAEGIVEKYARGSKQDDLADAVIMVMYYLETYSNQLPVDA